MTLQDTQHDGVEPRGIHGSAQDPTDPPRAVPPPLIESGAFLTIIPRDAGGNVVEPATVPDTVPTTRAPGPRPDEITGFTLETDATDEGAFLSTRAGIDVDRDFTGLPPGVRVGDYEILSLIGSGGFCSVYKALDINLDRFAALKFRRPEGMSDAKLAKYFEREAKALAKLKHCSSVVDIYTMGKWERRAYLALEFIESSAWSLIKESPGGLPCERALEITIEVADAVYHAHQAGIIHRDIKPGNILLRGNNGAVKLADFGLAVFYEREERLAGEVCGTPSYMSPEQFRGDPVGPSTDVFSLGVTLYELLCGRRPYGGRDFEDVRKNVLEGRRPPLREHRRDIPAPLEEIVDKALARDPAKRFDSAGEMCALLREVLYPAKRGFSSTAPRSALRERIFRFFIPSARPYTAFMSYRRAGGAEVARSIRSELLRLGKKVFLDVDDLGVHMFDDRLLETIESTTSFIPILSPGCLDRCTQHDDWFRREISHAIRSDRNIIPVTLPGFEFPLPEDMPIGLRDLPRYQSVAYSHDYFKATMDKLIAFLGQPDLRS